MRNSGLHAVVEAVGDHGIEYMTGGRVVVLGPTGRNFAAGMSGGIAYVLDEAEQLSGRCNQDMVDLERLEDEDDVNELKGLIWQHAHHTGSRRARMILRCWDQFQHFFVKVMPRDYKRMLLAIEEAKTTGLTGDEAILAAFHVGTPLSSPEIRLQKTY